MYNVTFIIPVLGLVGLLLVLQNNVSICLQDFLSAFFPVSSIEFYKVS
jgi:hypothetical protein